MLSDATAPNTTFADCSACAHPLLPGPRGLTCLNTDCELYFEVILAEADAEAEARRPRSAPSRRVP
ncbi:hypothetical protein [Subtercola endophyticus]|uniref:hypothetical protein n=1 Tax=Subtercola endophyticus TaxID=2895559 RepID=UPI001E32AE7D|nr:hypothetical protein [Subtercola endophyticus]UFS57496.1 hypothetical protein LQ955_10520 [Subtercola endophyticus]